MNSADMSESMSMNNLLMNIGFPAIFLIVATTNPRNLLMKAICIALAYFSLILLDGGTVMGSFMGMGTPGGDDILGKDSSPFGLIFLGISLWGYVLISYGAGKREGKDSEL